MGLIYGENSQEEGAMPNVLLVVHRRAIVQALIDKLQKNSGISLVYEANFSHAEIAGVLHNAEVVLIEVAESGMHNLDYCLNLCQEIRGLVPECKLIIMCSEQDEESVKRVIKAQWEGKIDDFVFYDVTMDYLVSKLKSI